MGNIDIGITNTVKSIFEKDKKKSEVEDHQLILTDEYFEIEVNCDNLTFFEWKNQLVKFLWEKYTFQIKDITEKDKNFDFGKLYIILKKNFYEGKNFENTYKEVKDLI